VDAPPDITVCPCCGHRALEATLCSVCAWDERSATGGWTGAPREGLLEAQRCYAQIGVCDPALVELGRPPIAVEARPAWWRSLDAAPEGVAQEIERAFASVGLDGGVTLAEAELIDDYALPSRDEHARPPAGHGTGPPWQHLTREGLERYGWGNFAFQDPRGIRYHTPAYLTLGLRDGVPVAGTDSLISALVSGHRRDAVVRLMSPVERRAIARYFALLLARGDFYRFDAERALRGPWGEALDPEERAFALGVA
jgi:hypothetical protein